MPVTDLTDATRTTYLRASQVDVLRSLTTDNEPHPIANEVGRHSIGERTPGPMLAGDHVLPKVRTLSEPR